MGSNINAKQQMVTVEFEIPVEVFSRLQADVDAVNKPKNMDITTVKTAVLKTIDSMTLHFQIKVGYWGRVFDLWVGHEWTMSRVWEELERTCKIKREGLAFYGRWERNAG